MSRRPTPSASRSVRLKVGFILARHFTLTAFANFVDTLRLAADEGDRSRQILCSWEVMSPNRHAVSASCGVEIVPTSGLLDPREFHYIVVVGGLLTRGPQIDDKSASYLHRAAAAGTPLVGVCTGSFVLARLGLLAGRKVCVSWYHRTDFLDEFVDNVPIADRLYIVDSDRITCSGGAGVVDLASFLVERHVGAQAARKSLNVLLLDQSRAADAAQPTPDVAPATADPRVRRAVLMMEQALAEPVPVPDIARRVGVSERQLDRLFQSDLGASPADVYRSMRLDYGHWLVVNTQRSIYEVATMAGFADGAHFAREFRRRFGAPPSTLRSGATATGIDVPADRRLFKPTSMAE